MKAPSNIVALVDTREQNPLCLAKYGLIVQPATLAFGDYTLALLRDHFVIERKSLDDLCQSFGQNRKRFEKELTALRGYRYRYVIVEANIATIMTGQYRSKISPNSLMSSIAKWIAHGIPFLFCDDHSAASYIVSKLMIFQAQAIYQFAANAVKQGASNAQ